MTLPDCPYIDDGQWCEASDWTYAPFASCQLYIMAELCPEGWR